MNSLHHFPRPPTPRCPDCPSPMAVYQSEPFCPYCTGFTVTAREDCPMRIWSNEPEPFDHNRRPRPHPSGTTW
jgi:hypothetical protein